MIRALSFIRHSSFAIRHFDYDHHCSTTEIELARAIVSASYCRWAGDHV
jgi:hypothetical protein